jgi:hypothetical protein
MELVGFDNETWFLLLPVFAGFKDFIVQKYADFLNINYDF